jgi:hypothetical protein
MEHDNDSRDYKPPEGMRRIFEKIEDARRNMRLDGDGIDSALDALLDAVEELALHVARESQES